MLVPFMNKVYTNSLPNVLSDHSYAICVKSLQSIAVPFADDIILLALCLSFLSVFMDICHQYGIKWRYDFNHTKCGVVTFGEFKTLHFQSMKKREWELRNDIVD